MISFSNGTQIHMIQNRQYQGAQSNVQNDQDYSSGIVMTRNEVDRGKL